MLHWNMKTTKRATEVTRPRRKTKGIEANVRSAITRKSNIRSNFCLLNESCNWKMLITLRCTIHQCSCRDIPLCQATWKKSRTVGFTMRTHVHKKESWFARSMWHWGEKRLRELPIARELGWTILQKLEMWCQTLAYWAHNNRWTLNPANFGFDGQHEIPK